MQVTAGYSNMPKSDSMVAGKTIGRVADVSGQTDCPNARENQASIAKAF